MNIWDAFLIAFVVLKLTRFIDWNWIWILAPFWISVIATILGIYWTNYDVGYRLQKKLDQYRDALRGK